MKNPQLFNCIVLILCMGTMVSYGQKQSKTFKENFKVGDNAVIEINTSHADIEFETWNKNEVAVEATVTIEDATPEEAKAYFEKGVVEILGNSSKISITTKDSNLFLAGEDFFGSHMADFHIEIPHIDPIVVEIPEIEELHELAEIPEIPELATMPDMGNLKFDYEAYKKNGEKYLKKWQEQFEKSFDKEHQKRMEEWGKRMEEQGERFRQRAEEQAERMRERHEERAEMHEERIEVQVQRHIARAQEHQKRLQRHLMSGRKLDSTQVLFFQNDSLTHGRPNIFYFNSSGTNKNVKMKKTIKVKMPKSAKLKMNVRHGEVKLAENTKNINATLSHASLLATIIDGDKTMVSASYSPVTVEKWNYGQLNTDYSDAIELAEVYNLSLRSNASEVSIERLVDRASIENTMGAVRIYSFASGFSDLGVTSEFGEVYFKLPDTPTAINVNASDSEVKFPANLALHTTKDKNNTIYSGYHIDKSGNSTITIGSKFGNVEFD